MKRTSPQRKFLRLQSLAAPGRPLSCDAIELWHDLNIFGTTFSILALVATGKSFAKSR